MKNPLISIVIPSYNSACYLADAIESVLVQDYKNWELIVVDDGSTDQIDLVVEPYLKNEQIGYHKKTNGGLSSARNFGIKLAKGTYILPLDADDKIHPQYISKAMVEFQKDEKLKLVYARAQYFGALNEEWLAADYDFRLLVAQNIIFCSAIFKKNDFESAGGYREEMKGGREDWDLWLRLLDENSKVVKLPEILFYYRKHKGTSMSDQFEQVALNNNNLMNLYCLNKEVFLKYYSNPIALINNYIELEIKYKKLKARNKELSNFSPRKLLLKIGEFFSGKDK